MNRYLASLQEINMPLSTQGGPREDSLEPSQSREQKHNPPRLTNVHVRSVEVKGQKSSYLRLRHTSATATHFTSRPRGSGERQADSPLPAESEDGVKNYISLQFMSRKTGAAIDFLRRRLADPDFVLKVEWWSMGLRRVKGSTYNTTLHRLLDNDSFDILFCVKPENQQYTPLPNAPSTMTALAGQIVEEAPDGEEDPLASDEDKHLTEDDISKMQRHQGDREGKQSASTKPMAGMGSAPYKGSDVSASGRRQGKLQEGMQRLWRRTRGSEVVQAAPGKAENDTHDKGLRRGISRSRGGN
jgi:hypothetical protein